MSISVILSTYNSPLWLEKVLWGYSVQTHQDFEIIIADDGSGPETAACIARMQAATQLKIKHVWHADNGFQKCSIMNKAIEQASTDYLLFSDGDCIPRADFLAVHVNNRAPGYFLSGGYFKLPRSTSHAITAEDIQQQNPFRLAWLLANGMASKRKTSKLTVSPFMEKLLNRITPTNASWNGHNASGWLADIKAAKGFDERMAYGGEDRELGERLFNTGIQSKQIRYSAICVHLDHDRGYVNAADLARNKQIRAQTKKTKATQTAYGLGASE